MSEEKIREIIFNLLLKNGCKRASSNYNHVNKFAARLRYLENHSNKNIELTKESR